jgi:hypothetical protein
MEYCDLEEALQFEQSQKIEKQNKAFVLMVLTYSKYLATNFRCSSFRVLN